MSRNNLVALLSLLIALILNVSLAQENVELHVPHSLEECYEDEFFSNRDNRLPMTLSILIDLIRKVETSSGYNQDIRLLTTSLIHRFRQDGVERAPGVEASASVLPYSPMGFQFSKFRIILSRLIPGNAMNFPNNTLSKEERCTLHFMLSSSHDTRIRGDEGQLCNQLAQYRSMRVPRSVADSSKSSSNFIGDVEFLETVNPKLRAKMASSGKIRRDEDDDVPDADDYDDDEATLRDINQIEFASDAVSQCPVENGVIQTPYGTVAAGNLLAGIAAGLQPQKVQLRTLLALSKRPGARSGQQSQATVDNRWAATLAGDLAEVALIQVPSSRRNVEVGANGAWNSTSVPKWYFLTQRQNLEMTDAEIRGGLDGLILGMKIAEWRSQAASLKLSQLLEMYYSQQGVLNSGIRACDRKALFTDVAPIGELKKQTSAFAQVLDREMQLRVTLREEAIVKFSEMAAEALSVYVPQSLPDLSCEAYNPLPEDSTDKVAASTDLYVFLDTSWQFRDINQYLIYVLEKANINPFGSRVTLLNANDCRLIVNTTANLGDVYQKWTQEVHETYPPGFNMPNILKTIHNLTADLLNEEKQNSSVGGRSLVALVVPQMGGIGEADSNYARERLQIIREEVPDLKLLFFGGGSMSRFSNFVEEESKDLFPVSIGSNVGSQSEPVVKRIKQIPRRIINYRCGSTWQQTDWGQSQASHYVRPGFINFYRLHPNYFYGGGSNRHLRIQGQGPVAITVCSSRVLQLPTINSTKEGDLDCRQINNDVFDLEISNICGGHYTIHSCPPVYLSVQGPVQSTSSQTNCYDDGCQFPDQVRYVVQTENLGCYSGVGKLFFNSFLVVLPIAILSRFVSI